METYKKFIIVFISISCFLTISGGLVFAQTSNPDESTLELRYPNLSGFSNPPASSQAYLPRYLQYIYNFAVFGGGLIAFLSLIIGGVRMLTSVGNPGTMQDARDQIFSSFIGLAVILGSFVLLREINPDLTTFGLPQLDSSRMGIIIYSDAKCGDGANDKPFLVDFEEKATQESEKTGSKVAKIKYLSIANTKSNFVGDGKTLFTINSFFSFNSREKMNVTFFDNDTCDGSPMGASRYEVKPGCIPITDASSSQNERGGLKNVRCIKIDWYEPGVWLFTYKNGNPLKTTGLLNTNYATFKSSQDTLPAGMNNNVRSVVLMASEDKKYDYGAILHNLSPPANGGNRGWAKILLPVKGQDITLYNLSEKEQFVSSITVFRIPKNDPVLASNDEFIIERQPGGNTVLDNQGEDVRPKINIGWNTNNPVLKQLTDLSNNVCYGAKTFKASEAANDDEALGDNSPRIAANCAFGSDARIVGGINVTGLRWQDEENNNVTLKNGGDTVGSTKDSGVSAFWFPEGENYLVLLYKKTSPSENLENLVRSGPENNREAALIIDDYTNLSSIRWNEYLTTLVVIRINGDF